MMEKYKILKMVWTDNPEVYGIVYAKAAKQYLRKESYKKYYHLSELYSKVDLWKSGDRFYLQLLKKDKHSYDLELMKELESYVKLLNHEITMVYYPKEQNPIIFVSTNPANGNEMYWVLAPRVEPSLLSDSHKKVEK